MGSETRYLVLSSILGGHGNVSRDTFLGLFWLMNSYAAHGMRTSVSSMFCVLIATPLGCMMVHALTKVRACSPTSSYIIFVNVMMIFHGLRAVAWLPRRNRNIDK